LLDDEHFIVVPKRNAEKNLTSTNKKKRKEKKREEMKRKGKIVCKYFDMLDHKTEVETHKKHYKM